MSVPLRVYNALLTVVNPPLTDVSAAHLKATVSQLDDGLRKIAAANLAPDLGIAFRNM